MDERLRQSARRAREERLRGPALLEALLALPFEERDGWVDELLALPELPADLPGLPAGTVPYVPCEVDAILRAVREAPVRSDDIFVDLGAGLGRPLLPAHLITGARTVGVELQSHLVAYSRHAASQLGLDGVTLLAGDAAGQAVPEGTVYFIYASFNGARLTQVMSQLRQIAARRRIILCAVDFEVNEPWLQARPSESPDVVFYDSE